LSSNIAGRGNASEFFYTIAPKPLLPGASDRSDQESPQIYFQAVTQLFLPAQFRATLMMLQLTPTSALMGTASHKL
jgi:hypothetical protein